MGILKNITAASFALIVTILSEAQAQKSYTVNYKCFDDINPSIQGSFVLNKALPENGSCPKNYFVGYTNITLPDGPDFFRMFTMVIAISPDKKYSKKLVRVLDASLGEGLMRTDFSDAANYQSSIISGEKCDGGTLQEIKSPLYLVAGAYGLKNGGITSNGSADQLLECSIRISNN